MTNRAIPPHWQIVDPAEPADDGRIAIVIVPGTSFGDGSHPTTQLCLQAVATLAPRARQNWRMLDFGSGSGILAIAAARLGAQVDAIEIDAAAVAEAERNAQLSGVSNRICCARTLDGVIGPFELVVANILQPVLLEYAGGLTGRLAIGGTLVLSGLVATDVPAISARYAPLLGGQRPEIFTLDEWRALLWRRT